MSLVAILVLDFVTEFRDSHLGKTQMSLDIFDVFITEDM